MKKISIVLFTLLTTVSCSDDIDKGKPAAAYIYPQFKNEFRVSTIEGKNERWGEFKTKMYYNINEQLDSAWVLDKNDRRIAAITGRIVNEGGKTSINRIFDYIPAISQDSVLKMDAQLKEKYGQGNYSLEDSIPKSAQNIRAYYTSFYSDGRISGVKTEYYTPRKKLGISGVDFNNNYLVTRKDKLIYEYNSEGKVAVVRIISDNYEIDYDKNTSDFKSSEIYKQIIHHDGERVNRVEDCILHAGESFSTVNDFHFKYGNEGITSISSENINKTFTRAGNIIKIADGTSVMTYEVNSKGYPTKIEDDKGNIMKITYEKGNGDFQNLISIFDRAMGNPYIR